MKKTALPQRWLTEIVGNDTRSTNPEGTLLLHMTDQIASLIRVRRGKLVDQCTVVRRATERDAMLRRRIEAAAVAAGVVRPRGSVR